MPAVFRTGTPTSSWNSWTAPPWTRLCKELPFLPRTSCTSAERTPTPSEVKLEPKFETPEEGPLSAKGRIALVGGILAVGLSTLLAFALATRTDKNSGQGLEPPDAPKPDIFKPDAALKPTITPI